MADTLERAVTSVASQLDERFEIVLVDDGSTDKSVAVMHELAQKFPIIRVVGLDRDPNRKLGGTRNESVRQARGVWCLLHLDCDDVYGPHIQAWVEAFHQIENAVGQDVLVAGQHIHMAKRDLLLENGPYINIFRGEDRNMYVRFGAQGRLWLLSHVDFCTRLPKTSSQRLKRTVSHTFDHMVNDFRSGATFWEYVRFELAKAKHFSLKLVLFRAGLLPITWLVAKFREPIVHEEGLEDFDAVNDYKAKHAGSLHDLLARFGKKPNWAEIGDASRAIFDVK